MIADGIYPGKNKRDYVLRRIMRRTLLHANLLGIDPSVFLEIARVIVRLYSHHYPNLKDSRELAERIIVSETASFGKVLKKGLNEFDKILLKTDSGMVSGEDAFKLHDTFGFQLELTKEIAESRGMSVDVLSFGTLLEEQRKKSR
jgi:alanyl-tRNA synthetase